VIKIREKLINIKKNWKKEPSLPLFVAAFLYTSGLIFAVIVDFITQEFRTSEIIVAFYTGGILSYIYFKEKDRWIFKIKWLPRRGELFVYLWVILSFSMFMIEVSTLGAFLTPPAVIQITAAVIGLFVISRGSKYLYERRQQPRELPIEYRCYYEDGYSGPSVLKRNKGKREYI